MIRTLSLHAALICALIAVPVAALTGCHMGPGALKVSSSQYSDAVRVAQSREFLNNLVRLRYRDIPVFLAVTNISTQFQFGADASISGNIPEGGRRSALGLGGGVEYSERPTLSFSILGGESFQKRMLMPLPASVITLLSESGWRRDRVFRLTVEAFNGLQNASSASGPMPTYAPNFREFEEAVRLLQDMRTDGLAHFESEIRPEPISDPIPAERIEAADLVDAAKSGVEWFRTADGESYQLTIERRQLAIRFSPDAEGDPRLDRIRDLLQLTPNQLVYDFVSLDDAEVQAFDSSRRVATIAADTRSLVGVLYYLSHAVEPPSEHVEAGLVTVTRERSGEPFDWSEMLGDLISIHSSRSEPTNAAVTVRHRGWWFYIADDDETSKSTFSLLAQLFALQAGEVQAETPVLTLPVGG